MFLARLHIRNFRCIKDLELGFQPGVNVIIGENNTGKTTVLDALRLGLSIGDARREIYVRERDFRVDEDRKPLPIVIDFRFDGITDEERGVFYEMLTAEKESTDLHLELHVEYALDERLGARRPILDHWGGAAKGTPVPPKVMNRLYHVHFDALRDASWDLRPSRGNRLGQLLEKLVPDPAVQETYAGRLNKLVADDPEWRGLVRRARSSVNVHLSETTLAGDPVRVDLEFVSREFSGFAETLRVVIPVFGVVDREALPQGLSQPVVDRYFEKEDAGALRFRSTFLDELDKESDVNVHEELLGLFRRAAARFDVEQNGLGCNNLIYFATVLGDIGRLKQEEKETYVALLVEEPEAHLHPQRQNVLFRYFRKWETKGIQSFITSHSPTITSKSDLDAVVVLGSHDGRIAAVALRDTALDDDDKSHLQKFLDVTKSQLFFAKGVMLVEGISEALLMPAFARLVNADFDLERRGIEIVVVGGLAFKPFANLFRTENGKTATGGRCAIVTDDDQGSGREAKHAENALKLKQDRVVEVFLAKHNLEYELYASNEEFMKGIYYGPTGMHPKTSPPDEAAIGERALDFACKVGRNEDKADLAMKLAARLYDNHCAAERFAVPEYLKRAVTWLLTGSNGTV